MTGKRVGFVLCSSAAAPIPSTRIAVLNMLPFLSAAGLIPSLIFEPLYPDETPDLADVAERAFESGCDVVVLQKVHGPSAIALAHRLREAGIRTVYAVCDLVDPLMAEATDATITISHYLKSLYPRSLQDRIHVVHDGIERPNLSKDNWGTHAGSVQHPLRAVLVTSAALDRLPVAHALPSWLAVRIVGRYARGFQRLRELQWTMAEKSPGDRIGFLKFLCDFRTKCISWDPNGVYDEMLQADIGIIPIDTTTPSLAAGTDPAWKLKSENRLTMKMSMALPVIATPIPSYEAVIEHGVNGFLARSARDWTTCLQALRDPDLRREIGLAARKSVAHRFSMAEQARKLMRVLFE